MSQPAEDQEELGSVSEEDPAHDIIENLYILKASLVKDRKIAPHARAYLGQMEKMVLDFPELNRNLHEWGFFENELLYFLRGRNFQQALEMMTRALMVVGKAPNVYSTKKFLFFITEKLYFALGGEKIYKRPGAVESPNLEILPTTASQDADTENSSLRRLLEGAGVSRGAAVSHIARVIMVFTRRLIEVNRSVVAVLNDMLFFELANSCLCVETAQMFNSIFVGVSFVDDERVFSEAQDKPWLQDGLYEIRRPYFDPEIVFRDRDIFNPIKPVENLRGGVFSMIYDQCTNLKNFADLSFKDIADMMLFKRAVYMSDELEVLLLEGKDAKAVKFYRRSLEAGASPSPTFVNSMVRALDSPNTSLDACIVLYYIRDFIVNFKPFTETRIRNIIQNLEYMCTHECSTPLKGRVGPPSVKAKKEPNPNPPRSASLFHSFDSNMLGTKFFHDGGEDDLGPMVEDDLVTEQKAPRNVLGDFSEFGKEFMDLATAEDPEGAVYLSNDRCEQFRILKVVQHVYPHVNCRFFFKPTYIILFRSAFVHVEPLHDFLTELFTDFISFLKLDRTNMAKVFLSVFREERKPRMREIKLEITNEPSLHSQFPPPSEMSFPSEFPLPGLDENLGNVPQLRVNRGVIDSEESGGGT